MGQVAVFFERARRGKRDESEKPPLQWDGEEAQAGSKGPGFGRPIPSRKEFERRFHGIKPKSDAA